MRYFSSPYVSVAERLSLGREAAAKLSKKSGRAAAPVIIEGRAIAKSFWGCAWCNHLEAFSDYAGLLKSRYAAALESGDAGSFAAGLAAGGYASDPAYAGKLKSVIASVAMAGA